MTMVRNMGTKTSDKEKENALKALREEISREIEEQLPPELANETEKSSKQGSQAYEIGDEQEAKHVVEAILFTASKPITVSELKRVLPHFTPSKIEALVRELQEEYRCEGRSFGIQEIAGGFECSTDPKYAPWVLKLELQRKAKQATQSALETLAILAYKQPVTRAEIEDLRGVDVSGVLATLLDRSLIKIAGRKEIPGRPFLYGTTEKFLQHFGLKSLQDLPNISAIRSLVENSVKREELLRSEKIVTTEESTPTVTETTQESEQNKNQ